MSKTKARVRRSRQPRRSREKWAELVDEWSRSGQSGEAFAASRSLPRSSFQLWRLKLRGSATKTKQVVRVAATPRLVPVRIRNAPPVLLDHLDPVPATDGSLGWEFTGVDGCVLRAYGAVARDGLDAALAAITPRSSGTPSRGRR